MLQSNDVCVSLTGDSHRSGPVVDSPPLACVPSLVPVAAAGAVELQTAHIGVGRGSVKPVDQFHRVEGQETTKTADVSKSAEEETRAKAEDEAHEKEFAKATAYWKARGEAKDWDCLKPNLSVYRYCGKEVKEDPRRSKDYRDRGLWS